MPSRTGAPEPAIEPSRNPRAEAEHRIDRRFEPRVLEPSPPAVEVGPWFADDPVSCEGLPPGCPVVVPVSTDELTWDELARDEPDLADWCASRWLGAWRALVPAPAADALATTRAALHVLAEHVLAPARHAVTGKIGLRWTMGGFGTPFYGDDVQARVDGAEVVVQRGGTARRAPITTVAAAAALAEVEPGAPADVYPPATKLEPDAPLTVDAEMVAFLSDWYGFATSVLEQLRAEAGAEDAPSRVQLWPEHVDLSVELGDEAAGRRAGFGASPGDETHPEPYLYVTPWADVAADGFWNDRYFRGASLAYAELCAAPDARSAALIFFRRGKMLLAP